MFGVPAPSGVADGLNIIALTPAPFV